MEVRITSQAVAKKLFNRNNPQKSLIDRFDCPYPVLKHPTSSPLKYEQAIEYVDDEVFDQITENEYKHDLVRMHEKLLQIQIFNAMKDLAFSM